MSFTLLRAATTEPRAQLDDGLCAVRASMVRRPRAALTEAEVIFELSPRAVGEWDFRTIYAFNGQNGRSFPYARFSSLAQAKSTEPNLLRRDQWYWRVYELSLA